MAMYFQDRQAEYEEPVRIYSRPGVRPPVVAPVPAARTPHHVLAYLLFAVFCFVVTLFLPRFL